MESRGTCELTTTVYRYECDEPLVSGAVGITTKLIATGLVALYWLPDFTAGM